MKPTFEEIAAEIKKHTYYPEGGEVKLGYVSMPHKAFVEMKKVFGINHPFVAAYTREDYMQAWFPREDMKKVADFFFQKQKENPQFIDEVERKWRAADKVMREAIARASKTDFRKLELAELVKIFKEVSAKGHEQWNYLIFLDAFDAEGAKLLEMELKRFDETLLNEIAVLTYPGELSFTQKEKLELLKIAQTAGQEKLAETILKAESFDDLPAKIARRIKKHQEDFYWYQNNFANGAILGTGFFFKELKKLMSLNTLEQIDKQISQIEDNLEKETEKRDQLMEKLPELKKTLYFFQKMVSLRERRKENNNILVAHTGLILSEIAKKTEVEMNLLENMANWEIDDFLKDKENFLKELKKRQRGTITIASEKWGFLFITEEAEKLKSLFEESMVKSVSELTGRPASKGLARGKVKIINKIEEFGKFEKGDILVSSMTRPEFVPLMERAAAIVTNEGGLTCHAAIVSRELGIPCVVGTEIATKVLKDGDLVEVDANHGLVKIIK